MNNIIVYIKILYFPENGVVIKNEITGVNFFENPRVLLKSGKCLPEQFLPPCISYTCSVTTPGKRKQNALLMGSYR